MTQEKINIAELLKDCPSGMELDCTMYDNLYFDSLEADYYGTINCYTLIAGTKTSINFTKYGTFNNHMGAKCVIFPKGKTTWDGFVPPYVFKDGDILATDLGSVFYLNTRLNTDEYYGCYVGIGSDGSFHVCEPFAYKECCGLATEEEKQMLFNAIKKRGYKWNADTKTLEKLPKFKDGDVISDALATCIFKREGKIKGTVDYYCGIHSDCFCVKDNKHNPDGHYGDIVDFRLATEEEKEKLFKAIKENGYKWNPETKTLETFVEHKFKDGDILYAIDEGKEFIFILKHIFVHGKVYCYLSLKGDDLRLQEVWLTDYNPTHRLATEDEKQKLFDAIKSKGYKWNTENKTLEKLTESNEDVDDEILMSGIYFDRKYYADEVDLHLDNYNLEIRDGRVYAVFKKQIK